MADTGKGKGGTTTCTGPPREKVKLPTRQEPGGHKEPEKPLKFIPAKCWRRS